MSDRLVLAAWKLMAVAVLPAAIGWLFGIGWLASASLVFMVLMLCLLILLIVPRFR